MSYLEDHVVGDVITPQHLNLIKDMIDDGVATVNTLSLNIQGGEVINSSKHIKPVRVLAPDTNGIQFFASDGITPIATLDENGNLFIKGSIGSL